MTRLEWFDSGQALIAARLGVMPIDLLIRYDMYKTYLDFKENKKGNPRNLTSEVYDCDPSTVARAIYWFERDTHKIRFQKSATSFANTCKESEVKSIYL